MSSTCWPHGAVGAAVYIDPWRGEVVAPRNPSGSFLAWQRPCIRAWAWAGVAGAGVPRPASCRACSWSPACDVGEEAQAALADGDLGGRGGGMTRSPGHFSPGHLTSGTFDESTAHPLRALPRPKDETQSRIGALLVTVLIHVGVIAAFLVGVHVAAPILAPPRADGADRNSQDRQARPCHAAAGLDPADNR